MRTQIGIVGAGPRGLSLLERIVANERAQESGELDVILFDPNGPGVGCHAPDQPDHLLVNTVAGQITLFSDASVVGVGPVIPGPSFHQWLSDPRYAHDDATMVGPAASNAYYSRALFGKYLHWVYHYLRALAPPHLRIHVVRSAVTRATRTDDDAWELDTGSARFHVDFLFLTTGHTKPATRARSAEAPGTTIVEDPYPIRHSVGSISPNATVAIEGMGLSMFDVLAELTVGRGGRFVESPRTGRKFYLASGREPRIVAYSRSGLPLTARGVNQKGVSDQYKARFLFADDLRRLRATRKLDFGKDVMPLLLAEMELAYCEAYLREHADAMTALLFSKQFACADAEGRQRLVAQYIPDANRFSWQRMLAPVPAPALASHMAFGSWLTDYLRTDLADAARGNVGSPIKAASDVLRDLRDTLRAAIDFGGLTEASHRWLLTEFVPVMNRIAVGPPSSRISEMLALMEAGVLQADFGPGAHCEPSGEGDRMVVRSAIWPELSREVDVLVRARVSMHGPEQDASPLMAGLLKDGHVRPFMNGSFAAGGIEVNRQLNWIAHDGSAIENAWALGIPTEGAKFYTFVVPRPGVNSTAVVDAGHAVLQMLAMIRGGGEPVPVVVPCESSLPTEDYASAFASLHGALT